MNLNHLAAAIRENAKNPQGTIQFSLTSPEFMNEENEGFVMFEEAAGSHVFKLERTPDLLFKFYHSSPGVGTRVATVDIKNMVKSNRIMFILSWTPEKIELSVGPMNVPNAKLITAQGVSAEQQIRIGNNGLIFKIGDENVKIMEVSARMDGKQVLSSTAIDAWNHTIEAVNILGSGQSEEKQIFECVVTNVTLSILVTGFESYMKKRFTELEEEGYRTDTKKLVDSFLTSKEKEVGYYDVLEASAMEEAKTVLNFFSKKINFQNIENCKKAYKSAFGLYLAAIGIKSDILEPLKKYFSYRHRVVHVSALTSILNEKDVPPADPVFSNEALKNEAIEIFDKFIKLFHKGTVSLKS